ncbi:hypothetical protein OHB41_37370 [Streptomyces sp. NBC_01571]|uniref:hypothetical protein n=1 Tax=Streptomyces sp. NBC_01571 TaxID=2975883 RepID=UPI002252D476|nr:hypothetical protein [Streptomyces sp. NBC_01571]MCX4578759.1 hypothetical protein [Streptomyces sp. NBC_01571]
MLPGHGGGGGDESARLYLRAQDAQQDGHGDQCEGGSDPDHHVQGVGEGFGGCRERGADAAVEVLGDLVRVGHLARQAGGGRPNAERPSSAGDRAARPTAYAGLGAALATAGPAVVLTAGRLDHHPKDPALTHPDQEPARTPR